MHLTRKLPLVVTFLTLIFFLSACHSARKLDENIRRLNGAYLLNSNDGRTLKLTPYGANMVRLQSAVTGEEFYPDDHYEMVLHHDWPRQLNVKDKGEIWEFYISDGAGLKVFVNKKSLAVSFVYNGETVLEEQKGVVKNDNRLSVNFVYDDKENFTGLGHGYYAREKSINLKGQIIERNYGNEQIQQAPLIVPFYMSSKGYGVFLNSTFDNRFNFGVDAKYSMGLNDHGYGGQMDYFFIAGPKLTTVLDNYTQLTGRPRLPMKSMFGLQLSDKGHDHNSPTPSDQVWWQNKIAEHRAAGFPLDHVVNDNRWRAAGGKRCESKLAWDKERYPAPEEYAQWLKEQGLSITLDFNRCIGQYSEGWKPEFNIPTTGKIDFEQSAPDLTNAEFRRWFWLTFEDKGLNRAKGYPGDALWIDEFDEMGAAPRKMVLANGQSSAEMRNYWFFLIAKSLVEQGWDKANLNQRPFVWVRGMTAGAQRYATLWSGDIYPNHNDMTTQIVGMQLAGLSGFPYWGHDAGGFFDWQAGKGPDADLYKQWALAFGSFAPIWKPHGMGHSRWPLDRSSNEQESAHRYSKLRYQLMPYMYTAAHEAASKGTPIARAMLLDFQHEPKAWEYDLQYMWGPSILVAPNSTADESKAVWLPKGMWYEFGSSKSITGGKELSVNVPHGEIPIYVKAGGIIPKRDYALSTAFIDKEKLTLDIYAGDDGEFVLIEDDDRTEAYRQNKELMRTTIQYRQNSGQITIGGAEGNYEGAPEERGYQINIYDATLNIPCVKHGEKEIATQQVASGVYRFSYKKTDIRRGLRFTLCR